MSKKCSYCWGKSKVLENLIVLNCRHQLCKNCLFLLNSKKVKHCPLCYEKINEEIFYEISNSSLTTDLSIVPLKLNEPISECLSKYKSTSKFFLSLTRSLFVMNNLQNFKASLSKLPSANCLNPSELIPYLEILKDFNIQEVLNLKISQINSMFLSEYRRSFLKLLFSEILYQQTENDKLWLGSKLRNNADITSPTIIDIKNIGNISLKLYSIGFGISFDKSDTFYCDKIFFELEEKKFFVHGKEFNKDNTNFFFEINTLDIEIKPGKILNVSFTPENRYYLAIKDQSVHYFKGCDIFTTNSCKISILSYLRFR